MNTRQYVSLIPRLFVLLLLIGSRCTHPKHTNRQESTKLQQQELLTLQQQEKLLVAELEEYMQPASWGIFKGKIIREMKEHPSAAKHQLKTSEDVYSRLTQAIKEFKSTGNFDAQEKGVAVLMELMRGGFKAETVEQGIEGLEKWIGLLQNLRRQYKLQKIRR